MTLPPVGKGCMRIEEPVGGLLGGPQILYCHPCSTISGLDRSLYLFSQMTAAALPKCAGSAFGSLCQGFSQGLDSWVGSKHITGFVAFGSAPSCSCQGSFSLIPVHIRKRKRGIFSSCHAWWWHCSGLELASSQQRDFVPTETQEN